MRFSGGRGSRRESGGINVTSLVDIIFNLLLFFMLTTSFSESAGLEVQLPSSNESDLAVSANDLVVVLTKTGTVMIDGEVIGRDQLEPRLQAHKDLPRAGTVLLEADDRVPHGKVVELMNVAKKIGVKTVGIAVAP